MKSRYFIIISLFFYSLFANYEIDYTKKIETTTNLIEKINLLNDFSERLQEDGKYEEAMIKAKSALILAKQGKYTAEIASTDNNIGHILYFLEDYKEAITHFTSSIKYKDKIDNKLFNDSMIFLGKSYYMLKNIDKATEILEKVLEIYRLSNNKIKLAQVINLLGDIFYDKGDFDKALKNYFKALRIFEMKKNIDGMCNSLISIGSVFLSNKDYKNAEYNLHKAYVLSKENNEKTSMVDSLSLLGEIYGKTKRITKAIEVYELSYNISKKQKDKYQMAIIQNNIGEIYRGEKKYDNALTSYKKAYEIFNKLDDQLNAAVSFLNIGLVYIDKVKPKIALPYLRKSLKIVKELEFKDLIKEIYKNYSVAYTMLKDYEKALKYHKLYTKVKDEIFSESSSKNMAEIQTKYETEKKESKILLLSKEQEKAKIIKNSLYIGLGMLFILAFLIFNRYRLKTKAHKALTTAHNKLELASNKISEQNHKIISSIKYAERIQKAILPLKAKIERAFPENFVLFLPKDIVSGDFYWFAETDNAKFISVIDCTGHGVPGAFMSMIGYSLLNQIVNEQEITDPAEILENLSNQVKHALKQESDTDTRDGMDMCFCKVEDLNGKEIKLTYAGAKRPLFIVKKESVMENLVEIKGDRKSIGGYQKKKKEPFKDKELILQRGDLLYLTSDGYADQHNNIEKKFGSKKMRELFVDISSKPMNIQKKILDDSLSEHKNGAEQQDDITVIGIRV